MNWYIDVIKKYAVFKGRASRQEYWMFFLINIIISIALGLIDLFLIGSNGAIEALYSLAILLPGIGVSVRRLHDTGRSGWWFFVVFIPILGTIAFIVFMCKGSDPEKNQFDANPKTSKDETPLSQVSHSLHKQLIFIGIFMQTIGFSRLISAYIPADLSIFSGGACIMIGIMLFARSRSRSRAWGLIGYLPFFGLFILAFLKDLKTGRLPIADNDQLNLSNGSYAHVSKAWFNWAWVPVLWPVLMLDVLCVASLTNGIRPQDIILTIIALLLTYVCAVMLINKTTINIDSKKIQIQHSPLFWRKSTYIPSESVTNVFCRNKELTQQSHTPTLKWMTDLISVIYNRHEVWVETTSTPIKIMSFREKDNAQALEEEIRATLKLADRPEKSTTEHSTPPPETGSWV